MNPDQIRSDLIGAWILREWLVKNMPQFADGWALEVNETIKGFTERVKAMWPPIELVFVGQAPIARTAIERWGLREVAYLGAGTPTPFSPRPDQLRYYTDAHPAVIAEAARAGYTTQQVDIRNPADLQKLEGVTTIIATGLIHFLPDEAGRGVFAMLGRAGFKTLVFNHMLGVTSSEQEVPAQWGNFGFQLFSRSQEQLEVLMGDRWKLKEVVPVTEFYRGHELLGPLFTQGRNFYNIYHATAV